MSEAGDMAFKEEEKEPDPAERIPRPVPGGTMHLESLGRFIDNLLGDHRVRRDVAQEQELHLLQAAEMPPDPPPSEPPPPVPDGTGTSTRGGRP